MAVYAGASQLTDASNDEDDLLPIVAELSYDIEILTVEQAVMRLEFGGSTMLMFRNASHFGLNVVHLRDDGSIGWIGSARRTAFDETYITPLKNDRIALRWWAV